MFRQSASLVLLRSRGDSPELLLLKRAAAATTFAGAFVFPGGILDAEDKAPQALGRILGLTARAADARLGLEAHALAYYFAAVRECYEEAGILLASDAAGHPIDPHRVAQLTARRAALHSGRLTFGQLLEEEQLFVPAGELAYFGHWITPAIQPRRFDTRFFMALAPAGQEVQLHGAEMVECVWLTAAEVLRRSDEASLALMYATRAIVTDIGRHDSAAAAVAHAHALTAIETQRPCVARGRDGPRLFRAGDAPYAEIHWIDPDEEGGASYELNPGVPTRLDARVTRLIAPNPGVMTGPGTNTYIAGDAELTVIDPGPAMPGHLERLLEWAAGRIRWIVLTHTHADHAGGALALKAATGAQLIGRAARRHTAEEAAVELDRSVEDGELLNLGGLALRAVATPGHSANHVCYLLESSRMLFTGDHIMQGSTVVIAPPDGHLRSYLDSLTRLLDMEIAILAPGHGFLIGNPQAEVRRLLGHRAERERRVRAALAAAGGRATTATLLPRVYADVPPSRHALAACSLQAHLDKLVEDGEIRLEGGLYLNIN